MSQARVTSRQRAGRPDHRIFCITAHCTLQEVCQKNPTNWLMIEPTGAIASNLGREHNLLDASTVVTVLTCADDSPESLFAHLACTSSQKSLARFATNLEPNGQVGGARVDTLE